MESPCKYIVVDTEGSGLFDYKKPADAEGQPRMAEIVMLFVDTELEIERDYRAVIRPDGWVMPPEVAEINKLYHEFLMEHGVPVADALAVYNDAIAEGRVMAAHNAQHDAKQIRAELRRAGLPDKFEDAPNLCTMRTLTDVCRIPHANGRKGNKFPKLSEAMEFFGIPQTGEHTAYGDAMGCLQLMRRMKQMDILPTGAVHFAKNPPQKEAQQ